jgi:hypothetical protein
VLRMIALIWLKDRNDVPDMIAGVERMISREPLVRAGHAAPGLHLREEAGPTADYIVMLDFDDEAAWQRYLVGEPHVTLNKSAYAKIDRVASTQYIVPGAS